MEQIQWGADGIASSRIGLGTWAIGGWMWGGSDDARSIATIHAALERGITLIDTAPAYGQGHAEEIVGRALAEDGRRAGVAIATKAGISFRDGKPYRDSSPARLRQELEDSLRRLRTDVIDLYQIHWPDPHTPLEDTARALEQFRQAGKIRAIGVSNFSVAQMQAFAAVAPLAAVQPPYNLFERQIEADVLPWARAHSQVLLCYGALCRGLLSGRIRADTHFGGDDLRQVDPKFQPEHLPHYLEAVDELAAFARARYGKPVLALAVRWVLEQGRTVALWGARRPEQLDAVAEVDGWHLDAQALARIDAILARCVPQPLSPAFMAPPA